MNQDEALVPADVVDAKRREAAILKAVGLDRVPPEQREVALEIARRYDLSLALKHLVMVEGRPFITRDGLLWIAHRSGQLDGIEVSEPKVVNLPGVGEFWTCVCRVYRKDMSRPFEYRGRYPTKGGNQRYGPEMAVKTAESQALRRAFNVSAATMDERWDLPTVQADVDAVSVPQSPPRTLSERVQERRPAVVVAEAVSEPTSSEDDAPGASSPDPDEDPEVTQAFGSRRLEADRAAARETFLEKADTVDLVADLDALCSDEDASPMALGFCELEAGHKGHHRSEHGTWPRSTAP